MGCIRFLLSPLALIPAAVVAVLAMVVGVAVATSAMGQQACFRDGGWVVSDLFGAIMLGVTFVGAALGGLTARRLGSGLTVLLMMGLMAFIALVPHADSPLDADKSVRYLERPESRPKEVGLMEFMKWSEDPAWVRYGAAAVGVTGVLLGSSFGRRSGRADGGARRASRAAGRGA